jgi:hypothetical protein
MAVYTDEKEKMIHDYCVSTTKMLEKLTDGLTASGNVTDTLWERTEKLLTNQEKLAESLQQLSKILLDVTKVVDSDLHKSIDSDPNKWWSQ